MRILLLGDYSNVHATLADGLRQMGHDVNVASNGDYWKNYPRDIDLARSEGHLSGLRLAMKVMRLLPKLTGYDVVQIINPVFLDLKAERIEPIYRFLRRHNRSLVLGAFGMDYYWVNENITRMPLRYSDFNIGSAVRTNPEALKEQRDWLGTPKGRLNQTVAADCDAIVAGLYEYYAVYHPLFPEKTTFIPFPIRPKNIPVRGVSADGKVKVFIGLSRERSSYKGTDIMLRAARDVLAQNPDKMTLKIANGVPFAEYVKMMNGSDVILDQLYSYTPSMNSLEAMSRGIIVVGGGEPENYAIIDESELRPIINVQPTYESVKAAIEHIISHPEDIGELKRQSIEYIARHHDYLKVARRYEALYKKILDRK